MLRADEDGQMLFLHNEFLLYIFKCKWKEKPDKKHLLQCKFRYNDNTIEI